MKTFLALIGALLGFLTVRGFFLGPAEEIGFRLFWAVAGEGRLTGDALRSAAESATFAKLVSGALTGLVVGALVGHFAGRSSAPDAEASEDPPDPPPHTPSARAKSGAVSVVEGDVSRPVHGGVAFPMGVCPNCDTDVPADSTSCACGALFGAGSRWKVRRKPVPIEA